MITTLQFNTIPKDRYNVYYKERLFSLAPPPRFGCYCAGWRGTHISTSSDRKYSWPISCNCQRTVSVETLSGLMVLFLQHSNRLSNNYEQWWATLAGPYVEKWRMESRPVVWPTIIVRVFFKHTSESRYNCTSKILLLKNGWKDDYNISVHSKHRPESSGKNRESWTPPVNVWSTGIRYNRQGLARSTTHRQKFHYLITFANISNGVLLGKSEPLSREWKWKWLIRTALTLSKRWGRGGQTALSVEPHSLWSVASERVTTEVCCHSDLITERLSYLYSIRLKTIQC